MHDDINYNNNKSHVSFCLFTVMIMTVKWISALNNATHLFPLAQSLLAQTLNATQLLKQRNILSLKAWVSWIGIWVDPLNRLVQHEPFIHPIRIICIFIVDIIPQVSVEIDIQLMHEWLAVHWNRHDFFLSASLVVIAYSCAIQCISVNKNLCHIKTLIAICWRGRYSRVSRKLLSKLKDSIAN